MSKEVRGGFLETIKVRLGLLESQDLAGQLRGGQSQDMCTGRAHVVCQGDNQQTPPSGTASKVQEQV